MAVFFCFIVVPLKKDVYFSHVTKIFYPLELKNQGEIVEFSSSNLEEAKDSCFNTIKIERNLVKLEATEPEIEKDVTGQNFGPILGKSKTQQFEKPVSVENINKNPEIKKSRFKNRLFCQKKTRLNRAFFSGR